MRADAVRILAVAAAYWAVGQLGLLRQVVIEGTVITPLWPPTGVALSSLLLLGIRVWPGIALGVLLSIATIGPLRLTDLGIIAGNTLAPVCAYLLLRMVGFRIALDRLRDGVALVFLGALAGMLISATIGTAVMVLSGRLPPNGLWPTWSAWWAGDAMGVLVVTPLILVLRRARLPLPREPRRWAEAAALTVAAAAVIPWATRTHLCLLFLVFPLLIWAALRFQLAGAAPCALLVSVLAITAAIDRVGPFAHHSLVEVMISLQALNGSAALTALLLAAIVTEQRNIRRKIEQACLELAEVVAHLSPSPPTPPPGSADPRSGGG
ncbi:MULTISPECIES: MASE1 domain-containing protein [unclassified Streptomyces]|uniref:MASE1 domain-containing protein n=1 Tax=unclassified Streptomyces TaxID=2593676 RepID=UPI002E2810B2|nr:MASE1 domain-containing protein [Streptomyces sp. NBC_01429]